MMKIKLIALDLDGTALNDASQISPYTREMLESAADEGIHIVVVTGRAYDAIPHEIRQLDCVQYLITSNGSSIFHHGQRIYGQDISPKMVDQILALSRRYQLPDGRAIPMEAFIEGIPYTPQDYYDHTESYGTGPSAARYVRTYRHPCQDMIQLVLDHRDHIEGMDFIVPDSDLRLRMIEDLKTIPDLYLTWSTAFYIEMAHGSVNKAATLDRLARRLDIRHEEIIAFGDSSNDLEMLTYAGHSVAMGNASDQVRQLADAITLSNAQDGVAHYLSLLQKQGWFA